MYSPDDRRTPEEWCEAYGLVVLDRDGWRTSGSPDWRDPVGLAEFRERALASTVAGRGESGRLCSPVGAFDRIEADLNPGPAGAGGEP